MMPARAVDQGDLGDRGSNLRYGVYLPTLPRFEQTTLLNSSEGTWHAPP